MPHHWQKPSTKVDVQAATVKSCGTQQNEVGCRTETDPTKVKNGDVLCDDDEQVAGQFTTLDNEA